MSGERGVMGLVLAALVCGAVLPLAGCSSGQSSPNQPAESDVEKFLRARELNRQALSAQKAGRASDALSLYQQAVQVQPKLFQAWNNMGVLYMERQNFVEAGIVLKQAADLAPTDPVPMENLALAYYRAGYADRSLKYYLEAIERAPNRAIGYRGAYRASEQLGLRDRAALERVERALLVEDDEKWRSIYMRKRIWLSNEPGNQSAGM